jgi:hypothetical protein
MLPIIAATPGRAVELVKLRYPRYRFSPSPCTSPLENMLSLMPSVQKQSRFRVLHHPFQSLLQIHSRHRAASHDVPFVCLDGVESQPLQPLDTIGPTTTHHPGQRSPTSRTSSSLMAPGTSLLFLKTSRLAPERRWECQLVLTS